MTDRIDVEQLVEYLASKRAHERIAARNALIAQGRPAVPILLEALRDPRDVIRWEAAKVLGNIQDPDSIAVLINSLKDEDAGVQWLVAEALIALGDTVVEPLLESLTKKPLSSTFRNGVHHVLHDVVSPRLSTVRESLLKALDSLDPRIAVPVAADAALRQIGGNR